MHIYLAERQGEDFIVIDGRMRNFTTAEAQIMPRRIFRREAAENVSREGALEGRMRNFTTAEAQIMPRRIFRREAAENVSREGALEGRMRNFTSRKDREKWVD